MSVLTSVFTRRPAPSRTRQRNRLTQPGRVASGLRDGGCVERLENRLALAVVSPFDVRFTANDTGDITFAANTIMTAPGDSPEAIAARTAIQGRSTRALRPSTCRMMRMCCSPACTGVAGHAVRGSSQPGRT
jgi:hypothetical protein